MKRNIILSIVFITISLLAMAGTVYFHCHGRDGHFHKHRNFNHSGNHMKGGLIGKHFCHPEFLRNDLKLSEEKISQIEELNRNYRENYKKQAKILRSQKRKLKKLLREPEPNMKKIRNILEQNSKIHIELKMLRIKQGIEINKILTPHQLRLLHKKRRETFRKRGKNFWP